MEIEMEEDLARRFKESLEEETPMAADAAIRAAIRRARPSRRVWWWVAAAAGVAAALGVGTWLYDRERTQQLAALRDDADAMLEIFGMASVDDVYSIDTVQL